MNRRLVSVILSDWVIEDETLILHKGNEPRTFVYSMVIDSWFEDLIHTLNIKLINDFIG